MVKGSTPLLSSKIGFETKGTVIRTEPKLKDILKGQNRFYWTFYWTSMIFIGHLLS